MPRDPRAWLLDILVACDLLADFTRGKRFEDYAADALLRSAVAGVTGLAVMLPIMVGVLVGPRLRAQVPAPDRLSFEVASVKPNNAGNATAMIQQRVDGLVVTGTTLHELIRNAYQLQEFQLAGAPGWIDNERFDIVAKIAGQLPLSSPFGPPDPRMLMLQSLLAERFKLVAHSETRDLPIYALVLARNDRSLGPQLRVSTVDCGAVRAAQGAGGGRAAFPPSRELCGAQGSLGYVKAGASSMSQLADLLSLIAHRIVADRTGLAGRFDVDLKWTPDEIPRRAPGASSDQPVRLNGVDIDPNGPSLYTAIQEQLGLKLVSTKGPVDVLVIEHVERPTSD